MFLDPRANGSNGSAQKAAPAVVEPAPRAAVDDAARAATPAAEPTPPVAAGEPGAG
jgi:hypothetical protein